MTLDKRPWAIASVLLIIVCTFASYGPTLTLGFTNWDEVCYITDNGSIQRLHWKNLETMFTSTFVGNYQPLTILSYALEYHFFGLHPKIYHATNLALHVVNAILVFWLVMVISKKRISVSLITALLFSLHPLRVESVSWVASRKDVLYSFFLLMALISYLEYVTQRKRGLYLLSFLLFLASLLSKATGAILPFLLCVTDYVLRRRFDRKLVMEKVPFFVVALIFAHIAVGAQHGALGKELVFSYRILVIFYGLALYAWNTFFPFHLSAIYPYPPRDAFFYGVSCASLIFISLMSSYAFKARRSIRKIIFGLLFTLVSIAPVLQFIPVGFAVIADRYTYLPSIGVSYVVAVLCMRSYCAPWKHMFRVRMLHVIAIAIALCVYSTATFMRVKVWANGVTLFSDVLRHYPNLSIAYSNRGAAYVDRGEIDKAIADCDRSIMLDPRSPGAYNNRGLAYAKKGDHARAIEDFTRSIAIDPTYYQAYSNRGSVHDQQGDHKNAIIDYTKAVQLHPDLTEGYNNRGLAYANEGDIEKALIDYDTAICIKPVFAEAWYNRGIAYHKKGELEKALRDFNRAIELNPRYAKAYCNRGIIWDEWGDRQRALADLDRAIAIDPTNANAYYNRGVTCVNMGDKDKAAEDFSKAAELDPGRAVP